MLLRIQDSIINLEKVLGISKCSDSQSEGFCLVINLGQNVNYYFYYETSELRDEIFELIFKGWPNNRFTLKV
ncbi:MAG: hypothetical protein C5B43_01205 [Verrucomicrobia bacterium]|nr:MAG: hypothetical protein C5B43_01205 [Verrucomicrobiota bacterium]